MRSHKRDSSPHWEKSVDGKELHSAKQLEHGKYALLGNNPKAGAPKPEDITMPTH